MKFILRSEDGLINLILVWGGYASKILITKEAFFTDKGVCGSPRIWQDFDLAREAAVP